MTGGVVKLLCRPGSQHFLHKKIELKPGESLNLGRCSSWRYEFQKNGLFAAAVVSRTHAVIEYNGTYFSIYDDGSLNGTFLNEERLSAMGKKSEKLTLTCNDLVRFGSEATDKDGKQQLPIICILELDPCSCANHDSLVPSSLNLDEMQEKQDEDTEYQQSESLLALEQKSLREAWLIERQRLQGGGKREGEDETSSVESESLLANGSDL